MCLLLLQKYCNRIVEFQGGAACTAAIVCQDRSPDVLAVQVAGRREERREGATA